MKKFNLKFNIFIMILLLLIILFLVRVMKVNVVGNHLYKNQEIEKIVFNSKFSRISLVCFINNVLNEKKYSLPNVERISVKFISPIEVEIRVLEKPIIGYIRFQDEYYYFDEDMYIIDLHDMKDKRYIEVSGLTIGKNEIGTYLELQNKNITFIIKKIAQHFDEVEMPIENLNCSDENNILIVSENITVDVGKGDFIEEKLSLLIDIYPKIKQYKGILDLSDVETTKDRGEYIFKKIE